jgi:hypothetical protein
MPAILMTVQVDRQQFSDSGLELTRAVPTHHERKRLKIDLDLRARKTVSRYKVLANKNPA